MENETHDPNLILSMVVRQRDLVASLTSDKNKGRFDPVQKEPTGLRKPKPSNQQTSTGQEDDDTDEAKEIQEPYGYVRLKFNAPPRDITRGFFFGTNTKLCDVVFSKPEASGISGLIL